MQVFIGVRTLEAELQKKKSTLLKRVAHGLSTVFSQYEGDTARICAFSMTKG
jgi:hypothetical protein